VIEDLPPPIPTIEEFMLEYLYELEDWWDQIYGPGAYRVHALTFGQRKEVLHYAREMAQGRYASELMIYENEVSGEEWKEGSPPEEPC
jgi:hypothetical protein